MSIFIENMKTQKFLNMKDQLKQQRLIGAINAEVNNEALDELIRNVNIWNAWDKIPSEMNKKFTPVETQS